MVDGATVCAACGKAQSVGGGAAAAPAPTAQSSGLNDNVAGLLAYLFIPAIIFLVVEPFNKNKFVRFHAFQGLFLHLLNIAIHAILAVTVVGLILSPLIWLAIVILLIIGAVQAFQGKEWQVPVIDPIARTQADKI